MPPNAQIELRWLPIWNGDHDIKKTNKVVLLMATYHLILFVETLLISMLYKYYYKNLASL